MSAAPLKLSVSLVPVPLWEFNLRRFTRRERWTELRSRIIEERSATCETCGKRVDDLKRLHLHEEWSYDEAATPPTVTLTGLALTCWHCHAVEHFGLTRRLIGWGRIKPETEGEVIAHFCTVNGVDEAAFHAHRKEAGDVMSRRSELHWRMDWGAYADLVLEKYIELPQPGRYERGDVAAREFGCAVPLLISWPGDPDYAGADGENVWYPVKRAREKARKKAERAAQKAARAAYKAELQKKKEREAKKKARAEAKRLKDAATTQAGEPTGQSV